MPQDIRSSSIKIMAQGDLNIIRDIPGRGQAVVTTDTEIANLRDRMYFPTFKELPNDNDIDLDFYDSGDGFHYTPRKHWCFFAEVVSVSRVLRLMLLVRDMAGHEVPVYFYTDGRGVEPPICHVQPGNTIAILYAHQHAFMDLSSGIRQEEISTTRIFPFTLDDILRLNDNIQASTRKMDDGQKLCHGCGQKPPNPRKCGRCIFFWYCNKECQAVGWKEKDHRSDCKMLDKDMRTLYTSSWHNFEGYLHFPL